MQQLDPKAVWLFLISILWRWATYLVVIGIYWVFVRTDFEADFSAIPLDLWRCITTALILLVLAYIWARLTYHYYRYELGEDGFRKEHGVIWKRYVTIPYEKIQNVDIYRGIIARLLGISDLQIQTAGATSRSGFLSEGRLPGLSREVAEQLRDELVRRSREKR